MTRWWGLMGESDERGSIVHEFRLACEAGDRVGLAAILHPRVTSLADGGPVMAGTHSTDGREATIDVIIDTVVQRGVVLSEQAVNGETGLVVRKSSLVVAIICLSLRGSLIRHVWIISAEERLRSWNRA